MSRVLVEILKSTEKLSDVQKRVYEDWRDWLFKDRESLKTNNESLYNYFKTLEFKWADELENFLMGFGKVIRR